MVVCSYAEVVIVVDGRWLFVAVAVCYLLLFAVCCCLLLLSLLFVVVVIVVVVAAVAVCCCCCLWSRWPNNTKKMKHNTFIVIITNPQSLIH